MRQYTWDEYYEKFYDWATSTQIRHLSELTSYGSPDEITEVALELCDEKAASRLVNKALDFGVRFQTENVEDLNMCVNADTMRRVADSLQGIFSNEQIQDLAGCVDEDVFLNLLNKAGGKRLSAESVMEILDVTDDDSIKEMALNIVGYFSSEQLSILRDYFDDDTMEILLQKSLKSGVKFQPDEVVEWSYTGISDNLLEKLVLAVDGDFDTAQAEELCDRLPEDAYKRLAKKNKLKIPEEFIYDEPVYNVPKPKLGFFGTLFAVIAGAGVIFNHEKKHNGHCNGDCAHCPPHYGYRYGRWYYGHGHQYGCEFGGNKGDGQM